MSNDGIANYKGTALYAYVELKALNAKTPVKITRQTRTAEIQADLVNGDGFIFSTQLYGGHIPGGG